MFEIRFDSDQSGIEIVEDELVCYAYLFVKGTIVGDLWLYNVVPSNRTPEWHLPNASEIMPFRNPSDCFKQDVVVVPGDPDGFRCFFHSGVGRTAVGIYFRNQLLGVLDVGMKPGHNTNSTSDTPIARTMPEDCFRFPRVHCDP